VEVFGDFVNDVYGLLERSRGWLLGFLFITGCTVAWPQLFSHGVAGARYSECSEWESYTLEWVARFYFAYAAGCQECLGEKWLRGCISCPRSARVELQSFSYRVAGTLIPHGDVVYGFEQEFVRWIPVFFGSTSSALGEVFAGEVYFGEAGAWCRVLLWEFLSGCSHSPKAR
jgi:hypothetical protein